MAALRRGLANVLKTLSGTPAPLLASRHELG